VKTLQHLNLHRTMHTQPQSTSIRMILGIE
jgi:hypothetical protein